MGDVSFLVSFIFLVVFFGSSKKGVNSFKNIPHYLVMENPWDPEFPTVQHITVFIRISKSQTSRIDFFKNNKDN